MESIKMNRQLVHENIQQSLDVEEHHEAEILNFQKLAAGYPILVVWNQNHSSKKYGPQDVAGFPEEPLPWTHNQWQLRMRLQPRQMKICLVHVQVIGVVQYISTQYRLQLPTKSDCCNQTESQKLQYFKRKKNMAWKLKLKHEWKSQSQLECFWLEPWTINEGIQTLFILWT